jgi:hypothetical protein
MVFSSSFSSQNKPVHDSPQHQVNPGRLFADFDDHRRQPVIDCNQDPAAGHVIQCVVTKLAESFRALILHSVKVRGHVTAFVCADLAIELLMLQIASILSSDCPL